MAKANQQIMVLDESWRLFFQGEFHKLLSESITEAYSKLFKICVKMGLIHDVQEAVASISNVDSTDLSATTSLTLKRFSSTFAGYGQTYRMQSLAQMLNQAIREKQTSLSPIDNRQLRDSLQRSRELEIICSVIKLGRNINAHNQSELLDAGFTLQICSSVLRLYEIFEFERVSEKNIQKLRAQVVEVLISACSPKKEFALSSSGPKIQTTKEKDTEKEQILSSACTETVLEKDDTEDFPLDGMLVTKELQRQKLEQIKLRMERELDLDHSGTKRKAMLLYGSNLTDILYSKPKSVEELKKVMSVEFLLDQHPDFTETQINKYGDIIVKVFA